ncbi:MAG: NYN domain-containing protein [Alphaproteobacteria bacterium]|nr:NYN domain-containing protein [Alphaproteobacteria bacterium]
MAGNLKSKSEKFHELPIYAQERVGLFIDGANLYAAARALNFDIDYRRLLEVFAQKGHLIRAFYYTALVEDQEYSPIRPLVDWLDYNGYTMVTKPTKEFTDAFGRRKIKGNMDIELAIDVMEMGPYLDHIVLFSGDGDFRRLVEAVQHKGKRVTVVSTIRSSPPMIADELRRQADNYIELQDLTPLIARAVTGGMMQPDLRDMQPSLRDSIDNIQPPPYVPEKIYGESGS